MSNRSKGRAAELEFEKMHKEGHLTYLIKPTGRFALNNDIFGIFDCLLIDKKLKTKIWVQIKCNRMPSKKWREMAKDFAKLYFNDNDKILFASRYDRKGWRMTFI